MLPARLSCSPVQMYWKGDWNSQSGRIVRAQQPGLLCMCTSLAPSANVCEALPMCRQSCVPVQIFEPEHWMGRKGQIVELWCAASLSTHFRRLFSNVWIELRWSIYLEPLHGGKGGVKIELLINEEQFDFIKSLCCLIHGWSPHLRRLIIIIFTFCLQNNPVR